MGVEWREERESGDENVSAQISNAATDGSRSALLGAAVTSMRRQTSPQNTHPCHKHLCLDTTLSVL